MRNRIYITKEYNNLFLIPTLRVYWDSVYEGPLESLSLELVWLKWSLCMDIFRKIG